MVGENNSSWWGNLKGLFNWGNTGGLVAKPDYLAPLNKTTGMIAGTNIHLNGDGTYTKFASRSQDITGPVSELTGIGADTTIIGADGKSYGIDPAGNSGWQKGLGYGLAGLQALSGLMNAYTGYKNYKLAKEQFGFEKAAMNRNIANQAKVINNTYDNAAQVAAGMIGSVDNAGNYGMTNQEVVDRYTANAEKKHVDGSKVG